ncbi:hypothetical protein PHMEG_00017273 [Phytophthora megakarya]|uniref:Reverse transcriptase n=1 Tax=Phytophthora megakarya TaxID=4795 RepID=A0A225VWZ5_9STRA|nr:hypothetical protein PHMEG_00017273 [Phytophthora megakarya]
MYDPTSATMRCPHLSCLRVKDITVYHVFWTCPAASILRKQFMDDWHLHAREDTKLEQAFFSLVLPMVPPGMGKLADTLYPFLSTGLRERPTAAITTAAENCWRLGVALYFHAVWRWRASHFDAHNDITAPDRSAGLRTRLRHGYNTVVFRTGVGLGSVLTSALASVFYKYLSSAHPQQYRNFRPHGTSQFLLFLGGSSRGNPGPGGCGSMVVQVGDDVIGHAVLWISSISLAAKTMTTNLAANMGSTWGSRNARSADGPRYMS